MNEAEAPWSFVTIWLLDCFKKLFKKISGYPRLSLIDQPVPHSRSCTVDAADEHRCHSRDLDQLFYYGYPSRPDFSGASFPCSSVPEWPYAMHRLPSIGNRERKPEMPGMPHGDCRAARSPQGISRGHLELAFGQQGLRPLPL